MIDYNKLSYKDSLAFAKETGLITEKNPSGSVLNKLYEIAKYCKNFYTEEAGDIDLIGVFLFRQSEQSGDDRYTLGYCHTGNVKGFNEKQAIIGLSIELLTTEPLEYCYYVFFHELAHLTEIEHNDYFQIRLNGLMEGYFNRNGRVDSRERRRLASVRRVI